MSVTRITQQRFFWSVVELEKLKNKNNRVDKVVYLVVFPFKDNIDKFLLQLSPADFSTLVFFDKKSRPVFPGRTEDGVGK